MCHAVVICHLSFSVSSIIMHECDAHQVWKSEAR
jgi:hypothetical protein